jgi:hypothetical protein
MAKTLQQINWTAFKLKHGNPAKVFEDLCYHLFCRKYRQHDGIRVDYNQVGIETYPIKRGRDIVGFQAKFFENKLSDKNSEKQILDSIDKAKTTYLNLNKIIIYTHQSFGAKNPKYKSDIESKAKPVKIEWVVESHFNALLFQPSNLDLAQIYFGMASEIGFIKNSINPEIFTLLQSSSYLDIPVVDKDNKSVLNLTSGLLTSTDREFILIGSPGSGKSILLQKLFQIFGGLDQKDESKMLNILTCQGAVPMLINLRHCAYDSLENIIRGRMSDNNIKGNSLKFIYLFDGLDELSEMKSNHALSYISELSHKSDTRIIIISCRSGNLNRIRAKTYLRSSSDLTISQLDYLLVDKYFKSKNHTGRVNNLKVFRKQNATLLSEIKDILLLSIFWEVIEDLPISSTFIDLLARKMALLLNNPLHRKNIEELNLLNPKEDRIIELNQDISFYFQEKFQFRLPQHEIQQLIEKKFPKLDYSGINLILNYIAALFFDNANPNFSGGISYVYQHRRYQEFFFAQRAKVEYEKNPKVLRDLRILSSHDFFQTLFLPYLRHEYKKEGNLVELIGLNLMDVYLGYHKGWGADDAYYKDSREFIQALSGQNELVFEQLVNDDTLQVKEKLFIPIKDLEDAFKEYNKGKQTYPDSDYLKTIWEGHLANLIRLNAALHKGRKFLLQKEINKHFEQVQALFKSESFLKKYQKVHNDSLYDPSWKEWEDYLYYHIVIKEEKLKTVYEKRIVPFYAKASDPEFETGEEAGKRKIIKGFIRVSLEYRLAEFVTLLSEFDAYQFNSLLEVLTELEYLPYFFDDSSLHNFINTAIERLVAKAPAFNTYFVFFKKVLNKPISDTELESAKSEFSELEKTRSFAMAHRKTHYRCAVLSYIYDRYSFELFLRHTNRGSLRFYNELGIFCTLFKEYISLLKKNKNINEICGDFHRYMDFYTKERERNKYLIDDFTKLWAYLFIHGRAEVDTAKQLIEITIIESNNIKPFEFFLNLRIGRKTFYLDVITEPQLEIFEKQLLKSEGFFQDYINQCFDISILFSDIDDIKAIDYFAKGINDGILRHGWRKDYIVSYLLIDALEILMKNKWVEGNKLVKYIKEVFRLTIRVRNITDGKGTQHGPYTLIKRVALYDIKAAETLYDEAKEKIGGYSNETIAEIIKAKIALGLSLDEVNEELGKLRISYDHDGREKNEYYIEKFKVFLEIAINSFYSKEEQKLAFESAYAQIETILKQQYPYLNLHDDLRHEVNEFKRLCHEYDKRYIIPDKPKDKYEAREYDSGQEALFISRVSSATGKDELQKLYTELNTYDDHVELQNKDSWNKLVSKTFEIDHDLSAFIDFMKKNTYPHSDYFTRNAKYCHFGLAAALDNINTRKEVFDYLESESGHGGFINIMKAYEVLRNKETCIRLFERFLQFCGFLVD